MANKKSKIEDMLTKVLKVFPSDIYIVYNRYIIGGTKSEENTTGYFLCTITDKLKDEMNENFDKDKIYYLGNVRTEKSDVFNNVVIISDQESIPVVYRINNLNTIISKVEIWSPILIGQDKIDKLFTSNATIDLFENNDDIPSLLLGKNMFPTLTEKNLDRLYYSYLGTTKDYNQVLFNLNSDYFEIYMLYRYL